MFVLGLTNGKHTSADHDDEDEQTLKWVCRGASSLFSCCSHYCYVNSDSVLQKMITWLQRHRHDSQVNASAALTLLSVCLVKTHSSVSPLAHSCSVSPPKRSRGKPALAKVPGSENGDISGPGVYEERTVKIQWHGSVLCAYWMCKGGLYTQKHTSLVFSWPALFSSLLTVGSRASTNTN